MLGSNIRFLRKQHGMSQDKLAEILGYKSYTTIQKWETGVSEPPLKVAHAIADLFHVDIDDLTKRDLSVEITTSGESTIDDDLAIIQRERSKMTDKEKIKLMNILRANFDEYNWDADDSGDIE